VLHQSPNAAARRSPFCQLRISPSFVAVRSEIRTESEERERGRSYRGNLSRLTLETQIRAAALSPRGAWYNGRRGTCAPVRARAKANFATAVAGSIVSFPGFLAARQSILRNLIARVPIADKYYSGCRTRTRNRVCVVAGEMRALRLHGIVSSWRLIASALCPLRPPDFPCP